MNCKDCKYVFEGAGLHEGDFYYECRKLPPVILEMPQGPYRPFTTQGTLFPQVEPDEWCGAYDEHPGY